jgi:calcineurin-like phosphoesterase family protein
MSKTFITSDHHFCHANFLTFKNSAGEQLRKFSSVEEMDEYMVSQWNDKVSKNDSVYHLGDLCFHNRLLDSIMPRLNGQKKVLIKGNHDRLKVSQYMKYFNDIRAYDRLDNFILSHVPIHPESLGRSKGNIHGHVHANTLSDLRYFNVCVDVWDYAPVDFELIRRAFDLRGLNE